MVVPHHPSIHQFKQPTPTHPTNQTNPNQPISTAAAAVLDGCGAMGGGDLATASIVYLAWQALYYLKIEVLDRGASDSLGRLCWGVWVDCGRLRPSVLFWPRRPHLNHKPQTPKFETAKLDADPELQTSLRWLAKDTKNPLHKLVLKLTRATGVLARDEVFDHRQGVCRGRGVVVDVFCVLWFV